jgi:hypothetical protein
MSEVHMALYYLFLFIFIYLYILKSKSYNLRFSVLAKLQKHPQKKFQNPLHRLQYILIFPRKYYQILLPKINIAKLQTTLF